MATNKPVFYRAVSAIIDRADQLGVTTGQFIDGCNRGVASGAIGINTGDFNSKESDFSRDEPRYATPASYIGQLADAVTNNEDQMWGLPDTDDQATTQAGVVGFDVAEADTAADATYGSTLTLTNYTGGEIPDGGWAWGFEAAGGDPVAPIVDAGGPYESPLIGEEGWTPVQLAGDITPGTDLSPSVSWVIVSGGTGVFDDASSPTAIFTPLNFTEIPMVLALTVDPSDGPSVVDTAEITPTGF